MSKSELTHSIRRYLSKIGKRGGKANTDEQRKTRSANYKTARTKWANETPERKAARAKERLQRKEFATKQEADRFKLLFPSPEAKARRDALLSKKR